MSDLTIAQRLRVTAAIKGLKLTVSGDYALALAQHLERADGILPRLDQMTARLDALEVRIDRTERKLRILFWAIYAGTILAGMGWLS